jgi:virulence factor Mce-like protein
MARTPRRRLELVLGLVLAAVMVGTVVVIYESFRGNFGDDVVVSARIEQAGDALEQGDIVTYRDVIVGEVTSATGNLQGGAVLRLKIHRDDAAVIPADVTAVAVPASLFGQTQVMLLPGPDTSGPRLRGGELVAADTNPAAASLQTALANAYALLTSVHPAQLDAALSALAGALDGQGENLGRLVERADAYLRKIAPSMPQLEAVITSLATVSGELAKDSPALLASLHSLLTVSAGIQRSKQSVAALLAVAPTAVDNAQLLLSPQNIDNAVTVWRNETPVLQAFADDPQALPQTIDGFRLFASTFSKALAGHPYLKVNIVLTGANLTTIPALVLGQQGHTFDAVSDPSGYTAADCPRYPGSSGPNCPTGAGPASASVRPLTTGGDFGGTSSSVGSPQEKRVVQQAAAAITGSPASLLLPDLTDLLLGPLLRGRPTMIVGAP